MHYTSVDNGLSNAVQTVSLDGQRHIEAATDLNLNFLKLPHLKTYPVLLIVVFAVSQLQSFLPERTVSTAS